MLFIKNLVKKGILFVVIIYDMNFVLEYIDCVVVLYEGKIIVDNIVFDVLGN